MLVVSSFKSPRGEVREGDYVWAIHEVSGGHILIEQSEDRFEVPRNVLVNTPVPPPMERLVELDVCFQYGSDRFVTIYQNDEHLFAVHECEHGNLFLEDIVPGIVWHSRLIFMGNIPREEEIFLRFWNNHKHLSDDRIHLKGIGTKR